MSYTYHTHLAYAANRFNCYCVPAFRVLQTSCCVTALQLLLSVITNMPEQSIPVQMVHEDNEVYSVTAMAELLFGNLSATSCYASHRLLSQERIFFKQVGRGPPRFQARSEKDVHSLKAKRQADEKVLCQ